MLIFAPRGRDAVLTHEILTSNGILARPCPTAEELCRAMEAGAGAAVLSEEALDPPIRRRLVTLLENQPPWSDFPLLLFAEKASDVASGQLADALRALGNVTLLDRPVRVRTMVAAVRSALRARRRQYAARLAIRSRDQFLAMLGHELRNPLAAIRMALDSMATHGRPGRDGAPRHEREASILDRQTRHLTRLVDDLLDVARVSYGKITLRDEEVDLVDLLRVAALAYEQAARDAGVALDIEAEVDEIHVRGERLRLDQIFGNLVTNALKYTPAGGRVVVSVAREGADAAVRIADTGIGIDSAMLPRVFDLFAQADQGLARSRGGLGLGLTLVDGLVRLHGGTVQVSSDGPGRGTEFTVTLPGLPPRLAREEARHGRRPEPATRHPPRSIVLVDDSEDLREMFEQILVSQGHEVTTADEGPTGVDRILATKPEVAFVDIGLPGFDGYEVARRVRAALGSDITLVAMSGYGQAEDRAQALEAGFDRHLTKPVDFDKLADVLAGLSSPHA